MSVKAEIYVSINLRLSVVIASLNISHLGRASCLCRHSHTLKYRTMKKCCPTDVTQQFAISGGWLFESGGVGLRGTRYEAAPSNFFGLSR